MASPLHLATINEHIEAVALLLDNGANIESIYTNDVCHMQCTPLHYAVRRGYIDIARLLITRGADVESIDYNCCTPLQLAALYNQTDMMRLLIEYGANIDPPRIRYGRAPIYYAMNNNSVNAVRLLLDSGLSVNALYDSNCTILHRAINHNHPEIEALLRSRGADPSIGK